jgi:hypothetical protein
MHATRAVAVDALACTVNWCTYVYKPCCCWFMQGAAGVVHACMYAVSVDVHVHIHIHVCGMIALHICRELRLLSMHASRKSLLLLCICVRAISLWCICMQAARLLSSYARGYVCCACKHAMHASCKLCHRCGCACMQAAQHAVGRSMQAIWLVLLLYMNPSRICVADTCKVHGFCWSTQAALWLCDVSNLGWVCVLRLLCRVRVWTQARGRNKSKMHRAGPDGTVGSLV